MELLCSKHFFFLAKDTKLFFYSSSTKLKDGKICAFNFLHIFIYTFMHKFPFYLLLILCIKKNDTYYSGSGHLNV